MVGAGVGAGVGAASVGIEVGDMVGTRADDSTVGDNDGVALVVKVGATSLDGSEEDGDC